MTHRNVHYRKELAVLVKGTSVSAFGLLGHWSVQEVLEVST
jgi:hypothetical protein